MAQFGGARLVIVWQLSQHPYKWGLPIGSESALRVASVDRERCRGSQNDAERRLVRKRGLEPPLPFGNKLLRLARLPVPPLPQVEGITSAGLRSIAKPSSPVERRRVATADSCASTDLAPLRPGTSLHSRNSCTPRRRTLVPRQHRRAAHLARSTAGAGLRAERLCRCARPATEPSIIPALRRLEGSSWRQACFGASSSEAGDA